MKKEIQGSAASVEIGNHFDLADYIYKLRMKGLRTNFSSIVYPLSLNHSYEIAKKVVQCTDNDIVAWKLGGTTALTQKLFDTDGVYYGPIVDGEFFKTTEFGFLPNLPVLAGEAEVCLRIGEVGSGVLSGKIFEPEDLFDAWSVGIEFPYSCFHDLPKAGLVALLADRCSAGALVIGEVRQGLPPEKFSLEICLSDGVSVKGDQDSLIIDPISAAITFFNAAHVAGFEPKPGQWISTGGVTSCVAIGDSVELEFLVDGEKEYTLKPTTNA